MKRVSRVLNRGFGRLSAALLAMLLLGTAARAQGGIESWAALQAAIDGAGSGDVISLTEDLTARETDKGLTIPTGKRITLDLNGHTLDRNMKEIGELGSAIYIEAGAILTLRDSGGGGIITGGCFDYGGGIVNRGALIMEGGCITGNMGRDDGGGLSNRGTMLLMGGSVTGNTSVKLGGGLYNHDNGQLTIFGDIVYGNSDPQDAEIFNKGVMTRIGPTPGAVQFEKMPVLQRYLIQLSALPVAVLMFALLLAVGMDMYLSRERRRCMFIIIGLVFGLVLQNALEFRLESLPGTNVFRIPLSIYSYSARPAILALFIIVVRPGKRYGLMWALIAANAAVYMTAFFSDIAFSYSPDAVYAGHWGPGPLSRTCTVVSALLLLWLLVLTLRQFHPKARRESWIPLLAAGIITISVVMDTTVIYYHQPVEFLTIAIAISCVAYYIWLHLQFSREHEEALRAGQRMQLALSQIKPHFLYNTLGTIEELCDSDPQAARQATARFSEYLRGNMDAIGRMSVIPFEQELEHTRLYLEIEQMRFRDALEVRYDIACTGFSLPALTLEPLAENAVRHGVRRNERGFGTVSIASREAEDHYAVSIMDDGPGFDPAALPGDHEKHIGIRNVRERLQSVCGGRLEIVSAPGKGTVATIIIPKTRTEGG